MSWNKLVKSSTFKRKVKHNFKLMTTETVNPHDVYKDDSIISQEMDVATAISQEMDVATTISDSSISSAGSEIDIDELPLHSNKLGFNGELQAWAVKHNIKHVALQSLLKIINENTDFNLPKDPRTFLSTPNKQMDIGEIAGGKYWHNGLQKCIKEIFVDTQRSHSISININIDGLPIYKSSKFEFWPILFNINQLPNIKPMIIGIYYGKGKPSNLNEFLSKFVEEFLLVMTEGVVIGAHKINVSLNCFICDSPARSFVKGVANFNSQHGCQKCSIVGEYSYITHINYYPNKVRPKRTDEDFRKKTDECHHKTDSIILKLPINMIDCFPIADSLHLVDLGVIKRLLFGWRDGTFKNKSLKWSAKITEEISTKLVKIKLPKELHRAVRGLDCLSHWKGLEYRNFLLYFGIVILKDVLRIDVYEHFLCLFCAITICSTDFYKVHIDVAEALCRWVLQNIR